MGLFSALGSYFGPIGTIVGGAVDASNSKKDANAVNDSNAAQRNEEYQRQKEFAQMGIRWKVEDAKAAGLHPLAALGTQGASYSPTIATFQTPARQSYADSFSTMGQNLNRSKVATMTEQQRIMENAQIRNAQLQNDLLEAQIAALRQPANPPMPDIVGPRVGVVETTPSRTVSASRGARHVEAAPATGFKDVRIGGGATLRLPAPETAEVMEAMGPGMASVFTGLSAARDLVHGPGTPQTALPKGYVWRWHPLSQSYRASKENRSTRSVPPRSAWTASGIARKRFSGGASSSY